jgi:hypothetical protein
MTQNWESARFINKLSEAVNLHGRQLMMALEWESSYQEVPKLQFPAPASGSRLKSGASPAYFEFDDALDPETVNSQTVYIRSGDPPTLEVTEVELIDEKTISVRPLKESGWGDSVASGCRLYDFILTPGIKKKDGRNFAGFISSTLAC